MNELLSTFSGPTGVIITALQVMLVFTNYSTETNPKTRARYSKFSQANKDDASTTWPSKLAMMVIYTPALLASMTLLILGLYVRPIPTFIPLPSLANAFSVIHMGKRCLEVLFLHKYSGRTDRGTPKMISTFYTLAATLIAFAAGGRNNHGATPTMIIIGTAMFAIGIAGNFYHHYLLATLRSSITTKGNDSKKYVAPRGGLFSFVATPHYLFELIGWLGIAIVSNHLNVYLSVAGMVSYLGGRSVAQNDFNRTNFDEKEWPVDRKNIVPFVF